jgi:hypothetical protein
VCVYVVIRSTLLEQDGDLPRRRVPEVSFVPFFMDQPMWCCVHPQSHASAYGFFVVIRLIQVMIEIDHVKMDVIVECVYIEVGRSQGRGQGWLCSKATRPESSGYRCVNVSLRRQLDPFMAWAVRASVRPTWPVWESVTRLSSGW